MTAPSIFGYLSARVTTDGTSASLSDFFISHGPNSVVVFCAGVLRTNESNFTLSATCNGVPMTEAATVSEAAAGSGRRYRQSIFYTTVGYPDEGYVAPLVVTASSTVHGFILYGAQLIDVYQITPTGATATDIGASTTTNTLALNDCAANSLILAAVVSNTNNTPTWEWTPATETYDLNGTASSSEAAGSGSQYQTTAVGNVSITSTRSASVATMVAAAVEFRSLPGAAGVIVPRPRTYVRM